MNGTLMALIAPGTDGAKRRHVKPRQIKSHRLKHALAPMLLVGALLFAASAAAASPIDDKYRQLRGADGFLGAASGAEEETADHVGRVRMFARGRIYWHPATGAHLVEGAILKRYLELGAEHGELGYPLADERVSFDRGGRVSKFQGGELIWHQATQTVSEVKATDLVVDLPFPRGEAWYVIQANGVTTKDSHTGPWVYCYDFMLADRPQSASNGRLFVAAADGPLVHVEDAITAPPGNVIVQRWGVGRYVSYLHVRKGSFGRHFGNGRPLPQSLPWAQRPVARSGATLAQVGDTGAPPGAYHLHFCVTTKPDRPEFSPFESVPVAFRNYSVSTDRGRSWSPVGVGVPKREQWIRRERGGDTAPQVNAAAATISFGTVKGRITFVGQPAAQGGTIDITVQSKWGEPLVRKTVPLAASADGGFSYEIADVPAFAGLKVLATYQGRPNGSAGAVVVESGAFALRPSDTATVDLRLDVGTAR